MLQGRVLYADAVLAMGLTPKAAKSTVRVLIRTVYSDVGYTDFNSQQTQNRHAPLASYPWLIRSFIPSS